MQSHGIPVPGYRDRYCAFADILGFRQLIEQLRGSATSFETLHSLLVRVHGAHSGTAMASDGTDFRAQSISDAVAISANVSPSGLNQIFSSLIALSLDLLVEGYFVRGAVVKAPLYMMIEPCLEKHWLRRFISNCSC